MNDQPVHTDQTKDSGAAGPEVGKISLEDQAQDQHDPSMTPIGVDTTETHDVQTTPPTPRRRTRRHLVPQMPPLPRPEYEAFAARLREAMSAQNLSASEVARRMWGETQDRQGRRSARNRDRISRYMAATSYPEPDNLARLAAAVGVPAAELAVTKPAPSAERPGPRGRFSGGDLLLTSVPGYRGLFRLQVDRLVPSKLALQIAQLLEEALAEAEAAEAQDTPRLGSIVNGTNHNNHNNHGNSAG